MRFISRRSLFILVATTSTVLAGVVAQATQVVARTLQETTLLADAVVIGQVVKSVGPYPIARLREYVPYQANCLISEVVVGNMSTGSLSVIFFTCRSKDDTDERFPVDKLQTGKSYILFVKKEEHRWQMADLGGCAFELRNEYGIFDEEYKDNPEALKKSSSSINGVPHMTVTHDELIQKIKRSAASQVFIKYDAQLQAWDKKIELEKNPDVRPQVKDRKAFCAWEAARAAVKTKRYDLAKNYLGIMRDFGNTWVGEAGEKQGKLLQKLVLEQESIPVRLEFAQKFWVDVVPALGSDYTEARRMLVDALDLSPTASEKFQLYQSIYQYSLKNGDTSNVLVYADKICNEYATNGLACDQTLFSLAQHYTSKNEQQKAIETLERLLTLHLDGSMSGMAHLGLSEMFAVQKDETSMLRHLEIAAQKSPHATNRGIMDTSDTRQVALVRLGRYYQEKKEYVKALEYFEAWQPESWCGNGMAQFTWERTLYMAQCLIGQEKLNDALNILTSCLTVDTGSRYHDEKIPALVVSIHESLNTLDRFLSFIKPHAAYQNNIPAQIALEMAKIRLEKRDGKIDELIARLRHSGHFVPNIRNPYDNWEAPAAAKALSELGGKEFPNLQKRLEELVASKGDTNTRAWVLYAIALSECPEAGNYLDTVLNPKKLDQSSRAVVYPSISSDERTYLEKTRQATDQRIVEKK